MQQLHDGVLGVCGPIPLLAPHDKPTRHSGSLHAVRVQASVRVRTYKDESCLFAQSGNLKLVVCLGKKVVLFIQLESM
jgi:hypothetical protein